MFLRTSLMLVLLLLTPWLEVSAQDVKPGASPAWVIGNPSALVSLELFNDYQCPACATFNAQLKGIRAKYKNDVQIIFRNYPLGPIHPNAQLAAQAAEAAGLQGHFVEMINLLYDNAKYWAESNSPRRFFESYARKLGLDRNRFTLDIDGDVVRNRIQFDVDRAKSLGVNATPTVFLNGKLIDYDQTANMSVLIDEALNHRRQ